MTAADMRYFVLWMGIFCLASPFGFSQSSAERAAEISHWLSEDPEVARLRAAEKADEDKSPQERLTSHLLNQLEGYLYDASEMNTHLEVPNFPASASSSQKLYVLFQIILRTDENAAGAAYYDWPELNGLTQRLRSHVQSSQGRALNDRDLMNIEAIRDLVVSAMAAGYTHPDQIEKLEPLQLSVDRVQMKEVLEWMQRQGIGLRGRDGDLSPIYQFWDLVSVEKREEIQIQEDLSFGAFVQEVTGRSSEEMSPLLSELLAEKLELSTLRSRDQWTPEQQQKLKLRIAELFLKDPSQQILSVQNRLKEEGLLHGQSVSTRELRPLWAKLETQAFSVLNDLRFSSAAQERQERFVKDLERAERQQLARKVIEQIEQLVRAQSQSSATRFDRFKEHLEREIAEGRLAVDSASIQPSSTWAMGVIHQYALSLSDNQLKKFDPSTQAYLEELRALAVDDLSHAGRCRKLFGEAAKAMGPLR